MRRFEGVVTGLVEDLEDPEGQGRIKVRFPWLSESQQSAWAPISSPLAGKDRGLFFMPEVGDEVLVAFEHGDFAHPFILGFLWNGVDTPPESPHQNRVIKTPGGHTLRFEDKDGEKRIVIRSDGGHEVTLDDQAHTLTVSGEGGANKVTIQTQAGVITIQASTQVSVQAPQVELTQGAAHPLVFGEQLLAYLGQLVTALQTHIHVGQMAAGIIPVTPAPPAPPLGTFPPPMPTMVSTAVRTG